MPRMEVNQYVRIILPYLKGRKEETMLRPSSATIEVPIFREDNFGSHMAIDEKQIGNDFYTILNIERVVN